MTGVAVATRDSAATIAPKPTPNGILTLTTPPFMV
jgi:hypothetical protein